MLSGANKTSESASECAWMFQKPGFAFACFVGWMQHLSSDATILMVEDYLRLVPGITTNHVSNLARGSILG